MLNSTIANTLIEADINILQCFWGEFAPILPYIKMVLVLIFSGIALYHLLRLLFLHLGVKKKNANRNAKVLCSLVDIFEIFK